MDKKVDPLKIFAKQIQYLSEQHAGPSWSISVTDLRNRTAVRYQIENGTVAQSETRYRFNKKINIFPAMLYQQRENTAACGSHKNKC